MSFTRFRCELSYSLAAGSMALLLMLKPLGQVPRREGKEISMVPHAVVLQHSSSITSPFWGGGHRECFAVMVFLFVLLSESVGRDSAVTEESLGLKKLEDCRIHVQMAFVAQVKPRHGSNSKHVFLWPRPQAPRRV